MSAVRITNIHPSTTRDELDQLFREHQLQSRVFVESSNGSKTAIGTFENQADAKKFCQLPDIDLTLHEEVLTVDQHFLRFTTLHDPPNAKIDIVALHGLNGHAFNTWRFRLDSMWLHDFLPKRIPDARVLVYGYEANVFSNATGRIRTFAENFLEDLRTYRIAGAAESRPIILMGHSMGGLVIKQALLLAHKFHGDRFNEILDSVMGVIFMGTPHGGGNGAEAAVFVTNIVKAANIDLKQDLIRGLQKDSKDLFDATRDFRRLVEDTQIKVYSLYEGTQTKLGSWPFQKRIWIVDEESATLGCTGEVRYGITADHISMVKFKGRGDANYGRVSDYIDELATVAFVIPPATRITWDDRPGPSFTRRRPNFRSLPPEPRNRLSEVRSRAQPTFSTRRPVLAGSEDYGFPPWWGGHHDQPINRRHTRAPPPQPDDDDPPFWMRGHPDPPSWSSESPDPPFWEIQPMSSNEVPTWLSARTESIANTDRTLQDVRSGSVITVSSLTSTNDSFSSLYAAPSIIHTDRLPNSNILPDVALTNFKTDISPWTNPAEYINAEANHVNTVIQEIRMLTGRVEIEQASFIGQPMVYSRLIAYVFTHLMLCASDKSLLHQFTQSLQQWKTWDNITKVQNHQLIKEYLQGLHQQFGSRLHPTSTFRKLLTLDAITLSAHLTVIVVNDNKHKELLSRRGPGAQALLNLLHARLDIAISPEYKPRHVGALIKLSKASGLVPDCLVLKGIQVDGDPVAAGGFGDVYKGTFAGRDIALKVLKLYQKSDMQKLLKNFSCEAVTWQMLSHPNVLPFYGVFHLDKNPPRVCLAAPWMENGNVVRYLAEVAPNADCVPLCLDVAQGLEYLHGERIVHGDIKGLNILISRSGRACLADFGLSATRDSRPIVMTYMTTDKTTGTLRWQAPELFPNMQSFEPEYARGNTTATDVYAYGLVCYEMFSDQYPFPEISSDFQVMFAVMQGRRPWRPSHELSQTRGLGDKIWHIMEACWSQDPGARPPASKVVEDLRKLPNRPPDQRWLNDFDKMLPSQMLSMSNRPDHPFATLASSDDETEELRDLKWVSRPLETSYLPHGAFRDII